MNLEDLTEFVRSHAQRELDSARTMGSLACARAARERLAVVDRHGSDRVIMLAMADRYGGYLLNWRQEPA